jgi:hypothetical protein
VSVSHRIGSNLRLILRLERKKRDMTTAVSAGDGVIYGNEGGGGGGGR